MIVKFGSSFGMLKISLVFFKIGFEISVGSSEVVVFDVLYSEYQDISIKHIFLLKML